MNSDGLLNRINRLVEEVGYDFSYNITKNSSKYHYDVLQGVFDPEYLWLEDLNPDAYVLILEIIPQYVLDPLDKDIKQLRVFSLLDIDLKAIDNNTN